MRRATSHHGWCGRCDGRWHVVIGSLREPHLIHVSGPNDLELPVMEVSVGLEFKIMFVPFFFQLPLLGDLVQLARKRDERVQAAVISLASLGRLS